MKSLEIVVETEDGLVIHLNQGQTYFTEDGREITYEQMLEWFFEGSLQQHGFYGHKGIIWQHSRSNNAAHIVRTKALLATV